MESSISSVYAAGDCTSCDFSDDEEGKEENWFQMRLWSQARTMAFYASLTMATHDVDRSLSLFPDIFAHTTTVFGKKLVLLGRYNAQGLGEEGRDYKYVIQCRPGDQFIRLVVCLKRGRIRGATLIGETELEETFENLILNGIDAHMVVEALENDLDVDLEDYFD